MDNHQPVMTPNEFRAGLRALCGLEVPFKEVGAECEIKRLRYAYMSAAPAVQREMSDELRRDLAGATHG